MTPKSLMCRFCPILPVVAGLLLAVLAGGIGSAWAEKRVALVIGNNDYRNMPKLIKSVNDAHTMAKTLKQLGFTVMVAENQDRRAIYETLQKFDNALQPGDTVFFFYSGQGFEIRGRNYLLPVDVPAATSGQAELVRDVAVTADRIVERLQNRKVHAAIVVFNASRINPFERSGAPSLPSAGGLAPMMQLPEGVFSVFSTRPHQSALDRLSDDDSNPNSVFTRIFAQELLKPGRSLVEVMQRTRPLVAELAETVKHSQVPVYFDQMVDDVFLNGKATGAGPGEPKAAAVPCEQSKTGDASREKEPQQIAALPSVSQPAVPVYPVNAPIANFMRRNSGWSVALSFADPPLAISWRFGDSGEFRETGLLNAFDPRTRKRKPVSNISLPADTPAGVLQIRYVDAAGVTQGPFPIRFEPMTPLIQTQREILEATATSWISLREFNGLLIFYTHLVTYRCAIREVRLGIDSAIPDRVVELPPCDVSDPNSVPSNARISMKLPRKTQVVSVELIYRDGSASDIKTFRR